MIRADVNTLHYYYPFGMEMPGRNYNPTDYAYDFNGKRTDRELKDWQDYGMRMYMKRLGRFPTPDPLTKEYPELTPYQFASNTPIQAIDVDGLEGVKNCPECGGGGAGISLGPGPGRASSGGGGAKPKINNTTIKTKTPSSNAKPSSTANEPGKLSSPKSTKESVTNPNQGNSGGNPPNNNSGQGSLGSSGSTEFKAETLSKPFEKDIVLNDVRPYKVGPVINPNNISPSTNKVIVGTSIAVTVGVTGVRILDDGPEVNNENQTTNTTDPVLFYGVGNTNQISTGSATNSSKNYTAPRINAGESVASPDI